MDLSVDLEQFAKQRAAKKTKEIDQLLKYSKNCKQELPNTTLQTPPQLFFSNASLINPQKTKPNLLPIYWLILSLLIHSNDIVLGIIFNIVLIIGFSFVMILIGVIMLILPHYIKSTFRIIFYSVCQKLFVISIIDAFFQLYFSINQGQYIALTIGLMLIKFYVCVRIIINLKKAIIYDKCMELVDREVTEFTKI